MAGAGYKLFNTGDVLTAAQVNTYLMEQSVMVFADAAARTTALSGVVAEGMLSYLKDTNAVEVYNGSAWVASDDPNAIQNTIVDAKGDLISATAADVPARLAVGTNEAYLKADSTTATGLKWDYDSWTSYTPTIAPVTGSFTTASATGRYKQIGKTCIVQVRGVITTVGTGSGCTITVPFTAANQGQTYVGNGRNDNDGITIQGRILPNDNKMFIVTYANGNVAVSGSILMVPLVFEIA